MKNVSRHNISGFTLVELLIVVLIIGILSAVAIPMYQGAVDKSRFSTLLPAAKSIKDAEESARAATGVYTDQMEDLDINMENTDLNFTFEVHNSLADPSFVRTTSPKLENVRLASYFDFNPMMAGQKHCEAKTGDERANRLCGSLLQGQELGTTTDGYNRYLLDDDIDKATCDGVNFVWSNKNTKCFKTEEDRCTANGMPYENGLCGYTSKDDVTIEEGGVCNGVRYDSCNNVTVNEGGVCQTTGRTKGCYNSTFNSGSLCTTEGATGSGYNCSESTFTGATCKGTEYNTCHNNTFTDGSICKGEGTYACRGSSFSSGSQCIGTGQYSCNNVIIEDGGSCISDAYLACRGVTVKEGGTLVCNSTSDYYTCGGTVAGKCIANAPDGCKHATFVDNGCCEGSYCPKNAPKCAS